MTLSSKGRVWVKSGWDGQGQREQARRGAPSTPDVAPGTTTAPAAAAHGAVSHLIPQSSVFVYCAEMQSPK